MTTIVYRQDHIASDSAASVGGAIVGTVNKCGVAEVPKSEDSDATQASNRLETVRWLWGAAGSATYAYAFQEWVENGCIHPPPVARVTDSSFDRGILIKRPGQVIVYEDGGKFVLQTDTYAMGSGRDFALGALAAGATIRHAVEIACQYDIDSHGPVAVHTLYDK